MTKIEPVAAIQTAAPSEPLVLTYPDITLILHDGEEDRITLNGVDLALMPYLHKFLKVLMQHAGETLSHTRIFEEVYGEGEWPKTSYIHAHHIRNALEAAYPSAKDILVNRTPRTYQLLPPVGSSIQPILHTFDYNGIAFTIDDTNRVKSGEQKVRLTGLECSTLLVLMAAPGMLISKQELIMALYGSLTGPGVPAIKIIDVIICKLRKKFRKIGLDSAINTVWARGYALGDSQRPMAAEEPQEKTALFVWVDRRKYRFTDLPRPGQRWVYNRKATAVRLVEAGVLPLADLMSRYPDLTEPEYAAWKAEVERNGDEGLRTTFCQEDVTHEA